MRVFLSIWFIYIYICRESLYIYIYIHVMYIYIYIYTCVYKCMESYLKICIPIYTASLAVSPLAEDVQTARLEAAIQSLWTNGGAKAHKNGWFRYVLYIHIHACIYVLIHIYVYIYIYASYKYAYTCIFVCMSICIHVHVYICVNAHGIFKLYAYGTYCWYSL